MDIIEHLLNGKELDSKNKQLILTNLYESTKFNNFTENNIGDLFLILSLLETKYDKFCKDYVKLIFTNYPGEFIICDSVFNNCKKSKYRKYNFNDILNNYVKNGKSCPYCNISKYVYKFTTNKSFHKFKKICDLHMFSCTEKLCIKEIIIQTIKTNYHIAIYMMNMHGLDTFNIEEINDILLEHIDKFTLIPTILNNTNYLYLNTVEIIIDSMFENNASSKSYVCYTSKWIDYKIIIENIIRLVDLRFIPESSMRKMLIVLLQLPASYDDFCANVISKLLSDNFHVMGKILNTLNTSFDMELLIKQDYTMYDPIIQILTKRICYPIPLYIPHRKTLDIILLHIPIHKFDSHIQCISFTLKTNYNIIQNKFLSFCYIKMMCSSNDTVYKDILVNVFSFF